jgi:hypothetical protein
LYPGFKQTLAAHTRPEDIVDPVVGSIP